MRIPKDVILIWDGLNSQIPQLWVRETSLDGKFIKGWGDKQVGETGGSATHSHQATDEGHTAINHTHIFTLNQFCSTNQYMTSNWEANRPNFNMDLCHTHSGTTGSMNGGGLNSVNFTTGEASNNPPFKDVIFIKAQSGAILKEGINVLWSSQTIPNGWTKNNNYDGKFLRGANPNEDAGGEGGSLTHIHSLNYNHTIIAHNHNALQSSDWPGVAGGHVYGKTNISDKTTYIHSHTCYFSNDNTANQTLTVNINYNTSEQVEPLHRKLFLIKKGVNGLKEKGIIGLWLNDENNIPRGWAVCDGLNNTPNLKNYFIKITVDDNQLSLTGGANNHSHANLSHTHSGVSHSHSITTSGANNNTNEPSGYTYRNTTPKTHTHTGTTDATNINFNNANISFTSANNEPEYRTVIFIQFKKEVEGGKFLLNFI